MPDRGTAQAHLPTRRELREARAAGKPIALEQAPEAHPNVPNPPKPKQRVSMAAEFGPFPVPVADLKDFRTNWLLSVLLGPFGADRFHRRQYATGALKALTLGGAGIWWAADQFSIAFGRALDRDGHAMAGKRAHRAAAAALSLLVVSSTGAGAALAAAPMAREAAEDITSTIAPPPQQQVWEDLAEFSGEAGETMTGEFTVTGDGVTFNYTLGGPGFAYLVPEGTALVPEETEPLFACFEACTGKITAVLPAGGYALVIQSPGGTWEVTVQERVLRDVRP